MQLGDFTIQTRLEYKQAMIAWKESKMAVITNARQQNRKKKETDRQLTESEICIKKHWGNPPRY